MAAGPRRRDEPAKHLLAPARQVELALEERAGELGKQAGEQMIDAETVAAIRAIVGAEFRNLAAELHHW